MNQYYYNFSERKGEIDFGNETIKTGKTIASSTAGGAKVAGPIGAIIGAVVGAVNSGFSWGKAVNEKKTQDKVFKDELLDDIFTEEKKRKDIVPLIVIGSVLLVGGVVTYFALKE